MEYAQQIIFIITLGVAIYILTRRIKHIKRNINIGKDVSLKDNRSQRWKNMLLIAFGQKKMFKKPISAFLHLLIYIGFLVINIEVLEFIIDGVTGEHRVFAPFLGKVYPVLMNIFEFLAVGVLFACVVFLIRRNVLRVKRLHARELTSWPLLDANLILIIEIALMIAILTMNAADQILQVRDPGHYPATGRLLFSSILIPLFDNYNFSTLVVIERVAWWFHILGILGFAIYITYSKHLHIFMAFPNTYYGTLTRKGQMKNMDAITNEVNMMLGLKPPEGNTATNPEDIGRFGAKDINDLTWKNLMDAYTCTECGRCTAECPANITGKLLSPRKIMMDTRDRVEEVGRSMASGGKGLEDGKSLLHDYITKEEINACTSCQACVEACPVSIDPLEIIYELKRYVAMEESGAPQSWNSMFQNIETNFAPWKFAPTDRFKWGEEMNSRES